MESQVVRGFLSMKKKMVEDCIQAELEKGSDPFMLLEECRKAMEEVGKRFETGEFFLSELIYSAEVFKAVSPKLEARLSGNRGEDDSLGPVVFGTPKGDIHDLGKNIVITFMRAQGFKVYDLGVDVPHQTFIDKIREVEAPILAMSALITPGCLSMKEVVDLLKECGIRGKTFVIIGGGVTSEIVRRESGADAYGSDPPQAVKLCKEYLARKT